MKMIMPFLLPALARRAGDACGQINSERRIIVLLAMLAHGVIACSNEESERRLVGVSVPPAREVPDVTWTVDTLTSVGALDGDQDLLFVNLAAARVLPEVGFWILDTRGRRVALFDSAGHHVRSIDSQGDGPGEFQFPVAFAVSDGDDLFVLDAQLSRLSQFRTSAGEHEFIGGYRVNQRFRSVCLLNGDLWFGGLLGNKLAHQVDEYGAVAASVGSPPTIPGMEMLGNFGETLAYPQLVRPRIFCDEENG